ncbi:DUF998 domain-containing protein [Actinoplanes sp. LDG1-06]|uniref:DUF998 domain-containing protein n=1 Tax=Paractinoplanes ovalisporus TaxID=2810368 RepID=A0ABS2ACH5_9ACTN|nr:DUF998 domain-containing protein [Actinoplanes ovalisporus]
MLGREGFDLRRHPLSLLVLGELGWIQVGTFVLTGLGVLALAVGLRRVGIGGLGGRAMVWLIGAFGVGLAVAGVFAPDAENGFPVGAPSGSVEVMSWHGVVHATAAVVGFTALAGACVVHLVRAVRRRAFVVAGLSGIVAVVLLLPMSPEHASVQLALTGLISFGWTTAIALSAAASGSVR